MERYLCAYCHFELEGKVIESHRRWCGLARAYLQWELTFYLEDPETFTRIRLGKGIIESELGFPG